MDELTLQIGGQRISGWTELRIKRSLDELAHAFSVGYTDHLARGERVRIPVRAWCGLTIAGEPVVTGYIDEVESEYDAESYRFGVSGRSRAGDLVDCSVIHESGVWIDQSVAEIAGEICRPFKVSVSTTASTGEPLEYFATQTGESAFEALTRLARMRGLLVTSTVYGHISIGRPGRGRAGTLKLGSDLLLRGSVRVSTRERFSEYRVMGQQTGDDDIFGAEAAEVEAISVDKGVTRYRPLIVMAESSEGDLDVRAAWERNVRAGKARRYTYTLRGWRSPSGRLWSPNELVRVEDPMLGLAGELLVSSVELSLGDEGPQSTIELCSAAAYDVLTLPEEEEGEEW